MKHNPFVFGSVVKGNYFIGRKAELQQIFSRLGHPDHPQSTAIVGAPHIGKSSLLYKIADIHTRQSYLGQRADNILVELIDLHDVPSDYTPRQFWQEAVEPLYTYKQNATVHQLLNQLDSVPNLRTLLKKLFIHIADHHDLTLVLLLDEFERLLQHPNFQDASFFAGLRSLSNNTGGIAIVTATRLSLDTLNKGGKALLSVGSPFFNNMLELTLPPFDDIDIHTLLAKGGMEFYRRNYQLIRLMAGNTPVLLQACASILYSTNGQSNLNTNAAIQLFYQGVQHHFGDVWDYLDNDSKIATLIMAFVFLREIKYGEQFNIQELDSVYALKAELDYLEKIGLIQTVEGNESTKYKLSSLAFIWWLHDEIIGRKRQEVSINSWLGTTYISRFIWRDKWEQWVRHSRGVQDFSVESLAALGNRLLEAN